MHLLVVEDDRRLAQLLRRLLQEERHVVEVVASGNAALELVEDGAGIEAVVLDIGLPDISGLEVARRMRSRGSALPILMLTARDSVGDKVQGLDAGADDYLVKPFSFEELVARLRALSRRGTSDPGRRSATLRCGAISLDDGSRIVSVSGRPVDLSPREFALLECLLRHPGQAMTRNQLLDHAWPFGADLTPNAVDTYVHYLREKLGPQGGGQIETVRGVGYRIAGP